MWLTNVYLDEKLVHIEIKNGIFTSIVPAQENPHFSGDAIDGMGLEIHPGLIDIHTHGRMGIDALDGNFSSLSMEYAKVGTTAYLPTTMTASVDHLRRLARMPMNFPGATNLGLHLEGPYLSEQYCGAQDASLFKDPDPSDFESVRPAIRMITLAPERAKSMDFISEFASDTLIAIGHTSADYSRVCQAIEQGACILTHLFNAMPPLLHRKPGPIGAAVEKNLYAELILDGFHVEKPAFLAALKLFGPERLILISDSLGPSGLPDGRYSSGGLPIFLENNVARLSNGALAGSTVSLLDCVKKAVEFGISKATAFQMAAQTPGELLKINKGRIKVGYDADFLLTKKDLSLISVYIHGERI